MSTSAVMSSGWSRVGAIPPNALIDARLQLHHAAQIAVSAAISYIPARPDDSHTALTWNAVLGALTTEPMAAQRVFRIALRVEDLTLHAIDDSAQTMRSLALPGRTIAEGHAWLSNAAAEAGLDPARLTSRKHYTIPTHPVANGAPFALGTGDFMELSRYWANAAALIEETQRATPGASSIRTWPHHFDIATLIALPEVAGLPHRTVGVGQSPGDDSYPEPYWYVGPYPYPATDALPPLGSGGGHWHTAGWVRAALPASGYVAAADQRAQVAAFVESAVAACRRLLGA